MCYSDCNCVVVGCIGCGRTVKCADGIKYQALDRLYWFCDVKCVELRRDYLTRYTDMGVISPPPRMSHILDTIINNSEVHEFYEIKSSTPATNAVCVDDSHVVTERSVPGQGHEISV